MIWLIWRHFLPLIIPVQCRDHSIRTWKIVLYAVNIWHWLRWTLLSRKFILKKNLEKENENLMNLGRSVNARSKIIIAIMYWNYSKSWYEIFEFFSVLSSIFSINDEFLRYSHRVILFMQIYYLLESVLKLEFHQILHRVRAFDSVTFVMS